MTLDPSTLDPATLPASAELNALIAEWCEWELIGYNGDDAIWEDNEGTIVWNGPFRPSTNPAHAGEARRQACASQVHQEGYGAVMVHIQTSVPPWPGAGSYYSGYCDCAETTGDKGKAEALATCRAIAAAAKARKHNV